MKNLNKVTYQDRDFQLTRSDNILNNKEFVKDYSIDDHIEAYRVSESKIEEGLSSWATFQKKGDAHPNHAHSNAIFSSVYYPNAKDSKIIFTCPMPRIQEAFNFQYDILDWNIFNSPSWQIPVESGDIIIFPGQVHHETPVYDGEGERMMIGASYFLKGTLGTEKTYNTIHL